MDHRIRRRPVSIALLRFENAKTGNELEICIMKHIVHGCKVVLLFSIAGFQVSIAQTSAWTTLLTGNDISAWEHIGRGRFVPEGDAVRTEGGMGLLWYTDEMFKDVEIRVVYRNPSGGNSGVFIRIPEPPRDVWMPVHKGYEVQIDDHGDDYHVTGVLYSFTEAMARPSRPGEWTTMHITLEGDRTRVSVNGELVTDHTEGDPVKTKPWWRFWQFWGPNAGPRPTKGYIGLQNHGDKDTVYFKEVSIRRLDPE